MAIIFTRSSQALVITHCRLNVERREFHVAELRRHLAIAPPHRDQHLSRHPRRRPFHLGKQSSILPPGQKEHQPHYSHER